MPAAAAVAARLALRRVHISPLGVARRTTPKPPRAWRVLPLLVGFADLGYFVINGKPVSPATQVKAFVPGYLLIIVGLVIAGPWLTMVAARVMARLANRPATLIAARRLADDPRAAFRAVSGLVLALLITTAAVVAIATQDTVNQTRFGSGAVVNMLTSQLADQQPDGSGETVHVQTANGQPVGAQTGPASTGAGSAASVAPLTARLQAIAGVQSVVVVRADPGLSIPGTFQGLGENGNGPATPVPAGAISCPQLATMPALGRCPAGAVAAAFPEQGFNGPLFGFWNLSGVVWPAVNITASRLDGLGVDAVNVGTTGSLPAVERARTVLENGYPDAAVNAPSTIGDLIEKDNSTNNDYQQLANVVILVSLAIAGLHARGRDRGRAGRPQAPVQPAPAHRRPAGHAAARRRPRGRRPAAGGRRRRDRHRLRRRRDERRVAAGAPDRGPRRRVLLHHRGRDPGSARHHRGHLPAARAHHRTGGGEKRVSPCPGAHRTASATAAAGLSGSEGNSSAW